MTSTRITYAVDDGIYGVSYDVVLPGTMTDEERRVVLSRCPAGVFRPSDVGLPGFRVEGSFCEEEPPHVLATVENSDLEPNVAGLDATTLAARFATLPVADRPEPDAVGAALAELRLLARAGRRDDARRILAIVDVFENLSANQMAALRARVEGGT